MSMDKTANKEWKHAKNKASQRMKEIAEEVRLMTNYLENNFKIDMAKIDPNGYACNAYTLTSKDNQKEYGPFRSIEDAYRFIIWRDLEQTVPVLDTESHQVQGRGRKEEKKPAKYLDGKDYTKYEFKGLVYNKRQLVLAIVKDWVKINKPHNIRELRNAFPQDIAYKGTFVPLNEANYIRFFTREADRFSFNDGTCYVVSNQWGGARHKRFVEIARGLGYAIDEAV